MLLAILLLLLWFFFLVFFVAISLVISSSSWSLFLFCVLSVTASAFPALAVLVSALIDACVHNYIGTASLPSSLLPSTAISRRTHRVSSAPRS